MAGFGKGGFLGQGDRTQPSACGGGGIFRMEDLTSPDGLAVTSTSFNLKYLVIGGGGGGGNYAGGGAGGYRSSMTGELSGGGCPAEPNPKITSGTQYCVVVGAGGAGAWPVPGASDERGGDSRFGEICSCGGGRGYWSSPSPKETDARPGGSGGGSGPGGPATGGTGITSQGTSGGGAGPGNSCGAGGGGACTAGCSASQPPGYPHGCGGSGGAGILSCITGTSVGRGGGGGGGAFVQPPVGPTIPCLSQGCGGRGGGYAENLAPFSPSFPDFSISGVVNTGGGAGARSGNQSGGGSGLVVLRYPAEWRICGSPGLTISTAFAGSGECASSITAGTGNVSWSKV